MGTSMASTVWCLRQVIRKFNDALGDGVFDADGEGMIQKYREFCAAREETDRYCLATDDFFITLKRDRYELHV